MSKIGRNDPCPCGSGQKYKRCCLPRDQAAAAAEREPVPARRAGAPAVPPFELVPEDDGLERVAMVAAARGDRPRAAEYYRRAADFVHARPEDYDPEMESYLREKASEFSQPIE